MGLQNTLFQNCTGLSSFEFPAGIRSIGSYAFSGCTGLTSIEIPSGVTEIEKGAFAGQAEVDRAGASDGDLRDRQEGTGWVLERVAMEKN